nr:methionyl-tRNA formyltransferase [Demetria terragena]
MTSTGLRVVFAGTPEVAVPSLRALLVSRHEVVGVVTRPDARSGRGRREAASPIRAVAGEHDLPVLTPQRPSDPDFLAHLQEWAPDVCPVVAYGALVPRAALDIPALGWVNLHFSLLPAWRGAAPVQHAILHGDEVTGASTFLLEEGLDTGPVLGTMTETVRPNDTSGDLLGRLADGGAGLLTATLDALADGAVTPVAQANDGVSLAPKLTPVDAQIDWQQPGFAVDRRIRACTPAPGAWTTHRGARLKIFPVEVAASRELEPGQVRAGKREVLVGTGAGDVCLGRVQPQGKKLMAAADWARGIRISENEVLGG